MQKLTPIIQPNEGIWRIEEMVQAVLSENRPLLESLSHEEVEGFVQKILKAEAIFFSAQGRSGFILRCFCMRLMHLGHQVYFCGETVTPAISRGDLLIVLSGSGETSATLEAVKVAKGCRAFTYGIVGHMDSRIASLVDQTIHLRGTSKLVRECEPNSVQMAGSLFEQAAFLFLEAVVLGLCQDRMERGSRCSSRHAVIE